MNYASPLNFTHINLDVFNGLTEAQQKAVLEAAEAASEHQWQAVRERVGKNYSDMRSHGMTVHVDDVDPALIETLSKAGEAAQTDWLSKTGAEGQAILDAFKKKTAS